MLSFNKSEIFLIFKSVWPSIFKFMANFEAEDTKFLARGSLLQF